MKKSTRPRNGKGKDVAVAGAGCLGVGLIVLINLAWVSLVIWGLVELILFLKRN